MDDLDRRSFVTTSLGLGAAALVGATPLAAALGADRPDLVAVKGDDAFASTVRAVETLGGIGRFVPRGARVGLLVNAPKYWKTEGSYTHTEPVLAVAMLCMEAGAKEVVAVCPLSSKFWERSELSRKHASVVSAVRAPSGDDVERKVVKGVSLLTAEVHRELLDVDVLINIPVAKHHEGTHFSGCLKNFMGGLAGSTCRFFHTAGKFKLSGFYEDIDHLSQCIADANTIRRADLCVLDGTVVLAKNGPQGPGDLFRPGKIVAGTDPVALDAYGAGLHQRKPEEIRMLARAAAHGLGTPDLKSLAVRELTGA